MRPTTTSARTVTLARGMVLDGAVIPGTEIVLRDPNAWWSWELPADRPDLRLRRHKIDVDGKHWTAGPSRMGERAAAKVVAAMKARKRPGTTRWTCR